MSDQLIPGSGGLTRKEVKQRLAESERVFREREVRYALMNIVLQADCQPLSRNDLLEFVRPHDRNYQIRLRCLSMAASRRFDDQAGLLSRAATIVAYVMDGDDG